MSQVTFLGTCVSLPLYHLRKMTEKAREITWNTFRTHVPVSEVQEQFPMYSYRGELYNPYTEELTIGFHIKDDFAVGFWKSKWKKRPCYYITWSGWEYVWTEVS